MIYDDDGGALGQVAKKLLLLGVVVIGVPLLALGVGALLGGSSSKKKKKAEEEKTSEEKREEPAGSTPPPPPPPPSEPPASSTPVVEPVSSSPAEPPASSAGLSAQDAVKAAEGLAKSAVKPAEEPAPAKAPEGPAKAAEESAKAPEAPARAPEAPPKAAESAPKPAEPPANAPTDGAPPPAPVTLPVKTAPTDLVVSAPLKPTGTAPAEAQEGVSRESVLQTLTLLMSSNTEVRPDTEEPSLEDRRQAVRLKVEFPVQLRGSSSGPATAIDLSLTGLRLKTEGPLLIGETCQLSLPGHPDQELSAVVQWCISGDSGASRAGLRFNDKPEKITHSWVIDHLITAGLQESHLAQKRRWIRVLTEAAVVIRDEKEREFEATMLDIGAGGARIRTKASLKGKEGVRLVIPTGKKKTAIALSATVVGSRADEHHLQFLPPGKGLQKRLETYILDLLKPS